MRNPVTLARDRLNEATRKLLARGIANGMHNDVQTVPFLAQRRKYGVDLVIAGDIAREQQVGVLMQTFGELGDTAKEFFVLIREGDVTAFAGKCHGDTGCDRTFTGDTDDQCLLAGHKAHSVFPSQNEAGILHGKSRIYWSTGRRATPFVTGLLAALVLGLGNKGLVRQPFHRSVCSCQPTTTVTIDGEIRSEIDSSMSVVRSAAAADRLPKGAVRDTSRKEVAPIWA